jgi:ketosteroid isomerase-like protein
MRRVPFKAVLVVAAIAISILLGCNIRVDTDSSRSEIDAFNKNYIAAHLKMDNAAVLAMWADDGVSLLPQMPPLKGKQTIGNFFNEAVSRLGGYHMKTMEIDFQQIQPMHDWAYEWGLEHQVLESSEGKTTVEGRGNILLILHKNGGGEWKIQQEMWNAAAKPGGERK